MTTTDPKPGRQIRDTGDVLTGLALLICSSILLFYLIPNFISEPPILQNPMMSPRWLPRIVGWLMLGFSVLLIFQGIFVENKAETDERNVTKGPWQRFAMMLLGLLAYIALFELLGAIIAGILATLILFVAHPVRTWWVYSLAFIFPTGVAFIFVEVMNVPLPLMPY